MTTGDKTMEPEKAKEELAGRVEAIVNGAKDMTTFFNELEKAGIQAHLFAPEGHMKGVAYQAGDVRIKGSDLGPKFTWKGLQQAGVSYDEVRDAEAFKRTLDNSKPPEKKADAPDRPHREERKPTRTGDRTYKLRVFNANGSVEKYMRLAEGEALALVQKGLEKACEAFKADDLRGKFEVKAEDFKGSPSLEIGVHVPEDRVKDVGAVLDWRGKTPPLASRTVYAEIVEGTKEKTAQEVTTEPPVVAKDPAIEQQVQQVAEVAHKMDPGDSLREVYAHCRERGYTKAAELVAEASRTFDAERTRSAVATAPSR